MIEVKDSRIQIDHNFTESRRSGQWLPSRYASPFAKGPEESSSARHSKIQMLNAANSFSKCFLSEIYVFFKQGLSTCFNRQLFARKLLAFAARFSGSRSSSFCSNCTAWQFSSFTRLPSTLPPLNFEYVRL